MLGVAREALAERAFSIAFYTYSGILARKTNGHCSHIYE